MKHLLWMLMLCPLAYAAPCPTGQAKDEAALVQMEHTWAHALEQGDTSALDCILANDFEEADSTGSLRDRSNMLTRAANPGGFHYELSELHAHVYGDFGYIRGVAVAVKDAKPIMKTRFTDIFVYRDGRWQCVAGQETAFPPPAR